MCGGGRERVDQTDEETLAFLFETGARGGLVTDLAGAGVFLVPRPDQGAFRYQKILVTDITYAEARLRGQDCVGFKWTPNELLRSRHRLSEPEAVRSAFRPACDFSPCGGTFYSGWDCICAGHPGCSA